MNLEDEDGELFSMYQLEQIYIEEFERRFPFFKLAIRNQLKVIVQNKDKVCGI